VFRKSQIAIEYAYRVRDFAPQTSVFWVHASNAARFEKDYREIADKIKLPGRYDSSADVLRLVSEWLSDEKNGRSLMILDNADDDDVFFRFDGDTEQIMQADNVTSRKMPLASFLPQTPNGSILVTSRNLAAAMNLVGIHDNIICVEPMDEGDALALLKTRISFSEPSESDAKALVQALDCIPLAITHAAAYIRMREPRVTISTYLKLFRESAANQTTLLSSEDTRDLRRDHSIQHAAITTWQISFNQIQKIKPAATDLLALISMFDRQGIPEYLLHDNTNQLQFEDAIAPLTSFALVRAQVRQQSFEMHRLVQLSTRKWLEQNNQLEKWRKESVRVMARAFPSGELETWTDCQVLLPHSKEVLSYVLSEDKDEVLYWASVARNTSWYLYKRGEYAAAEQIGRAAVEAMEKVLGPEHPDALATVSELGWVLEGLGEYKEAEAMHRRALEGMEKVLGLEHLDTLASVSGLGSVIERLGKYKEAEAMHRRALQGREKVLGPEHELTLISVGKLGFVLQELGKYKEVEAMHRRALKGREKVRGPEHPDTLTSKANLALLFWEQGRWKEAEKLDMQVLEIRKRVLGQEHPQTLLGMNNLSITWKSLGRNSEALALMDECVQLQERTLGSNHPCTVISLGILNEWKTENLALNSWHSLYRRNRHLMNILTGFFEC
jgi:tetratricopeptide (TPR) repeat protein